jgi:lipoyl(octanoyl) transferase
VITDRATASEHVAAASGLEFRDLGVLAYTPAYELQAAAVDEILRDREAGVDRVGIVFLVEHPPVITLTRRAEAAHHLLATPELLRREGVELAQTDRGGDITYHGPGQLVAYPILDLNRLNLGLHAYMRLLEESIIRLCASYGVEGERDPSATGVWTRTQPRTDAPELRVPASGVPAVPAMPDTPAKICAMGVRVRKWITMHGLAINVSTNLDHFRLIVPCGLAGRPVTSLRQILGAACPSMAAVKASLTRELSAQVAAAAERAHELRTRAAGAATNP